MTRFPCLLLALLLALTASACGQRPDATPGNSPLQVFAAASLKESLDAAAATYHDRHGHEVQVSFAASSALARQIEQGAPADVFISADLAWMDWLDERDLIDPATRRDLLGNRLVLIAPAAHATAPVSLTPGTDLLPLLGDDGRIALAMAGSVPAGKYAREAFTALDMWEALAARSAETDNVRTALMLVARGEAPLGVVYASDARAEPRVQVLATFPEGSHPPVIYPAARVAASTHPEAAAFVDWLGSPEAAAIFSHHGFTLR